MPNIKDLFEVYRPKPKDEQEFVDKHVVVKHKDENGNGDDVFNASNVKKVDRKKTRMGYDVPEDEKVYEETDLEESLGMGFKTSSEKSKFGPGHRAKLLNPEGRLSYLSQKAYKTAKHAKDAAKFYHSIGNLPTQTIDNKMSQYNKAYDAKHKMDEAVQLDKNQIANSILEMAEVEGVDLTEQELNDLVNTLIEAADEDTEEKSEMAQTQLHFIMYATKEILEYIKMGGEIEEWYQNKLSKVHSDVESLHSYVEGEKRRTGMVKEDTITEKYMIHTTKGGKPAGKIRISAIDQVNAEHQAKNIIGKKPYRGYEVHKVVKEDTDEQIDEVLKASTPMKTWIKDFTKSDAPQFKGKSAEKRREMAIAAKLGAEREATNEEVEQIDELSHVTLRGYRIKAKSIADHGGEQRTKGRELAGRKSYGGRVAGIEKAKVMAKEEVELDEVFDTPKGKAVGRAYIKRASTNAFGKGFTGGSMLNRQIDDPASREQEQKGGEKAVKTGLKRLVGIGRATDRLTKEEAEAPFEGPYRKPGERKDKYGNTIKNVPRHLAKQAMKSLTKEEIEQIDELSKEAIASYTVQAADDLPIQARKTGASKVKNRIKGINMAVDRLYTKEDVINNAINKFVPEEAKYTVDERFEMRLEDVPELHRPALAELFNGLTESNKKVMLNQLSEEAGLQKLINFVIENRND